MAYTLATLLLVSFSVVEANNSAGDSQAIAFTTTWPAKTGNNPLSTLCIETHVNLPGYTLMVTAIQAANFTLAEIGSPHPMHSTTCQELGFQYLAVDGKKIGFEMTDVNWWATTPDAHAKETLGKILGHSDLVSIVEAKNSAGDSQAIAFTTTWPAKTGNNPLSTICIETHVNLPGYISLVTALQVALFTLAEIGSPHPMHSTTCQELGFQYLALDGKKIGFEMTDVNGWATTPDAHATETLGRILGHSDLVSIVGGNARRQEGHTDSQPSNSVTLV